MNILASTKARVALTLLAVLITASIAFDSTRAAAAVPAPRFDPAVTDSDEQTLVLAGGCFWGVEAVFEHVRGVKSVRSGYSGGEQRTARYKQVVRGNTGHAESVEIVYDPRQISYGTLLQIFFSVAHDPTQVNRQGPDIGTHYRSVIFPADEQQEQIAARYITQLNQAKVFGKPIATQVTPLKAFYVAEPEHQDFVARNPRVPYVVYHDLPKLENLQKTFPKLYRQR